MLAKVSTRRAMDDPGRLIRYLADERKTDWISLSNFDLADSPQDLGLALAEIRNTQAMGRAVNDPTYHLVASFGPIDKPSADVLADVSRHLASSIGMEAHQRITFLHTNTANWHLHILINRVVDFGKRCIAPFHDYFRLSRACRELELKHDLQHGPGMHHIEGNHIMATDLFERRPAITISAADGPQQTQAQPQPTPAQVPEQAEPERRNPLRQIGEALNPTRYVQPEKYDGLDVAHSKTWRGHDRVHVGEHSYIDRGDRLTTGKEISEIAMRHMLETARDRFGPDLKIEGNAHLISQFQRIARESNLDITINNPRAVEKAQTPAPAPAPAAPAAAPATEPQTQEKQQEQKQATEQQRDAPAPAPAKEQERPAPGPVMEPTSTQWRGPIERPTLSPATKTFYLEFDRRPRAVNEVGDKQPENIRVRDYERVLANTERGAMRVLRHHQPDAERVRVVQPSETPEWARGTKFNDAGQYARLMSQAEQAPDRKQAQQIERQALKVAHNAGRDLHRQNPFDQKKEPAAYREFTKGRTTVELQRETVRAAEQPAQAIVRDRPREVAVNVTMAQSVAAPTVKLSAAQEAGVKQVMEKALDTQGKYIPAKETGQYKGEIIAHVGDLAVQRIGKATVAVHDRKTIGDPAPGKSVQIDYEGGKATSKDYDWKQEKKAQAQEQKQAAGVKR